MTIEFALNGAMKIHLQLCEIAGVESFSLRRIRGDTLTYAEGQLADLEDTAVLAIAKFKRACELKGG